MSETTSSAPSWRSPAARADLLLTNAVTSAPPRWASWIANRPTPPEAPVTRTRRPRMAGPIRSMRRAARPAVGSAAAWAKETPSGSSAIHASRDRHPLGPGPASPDTDHPGAGSRAVFDVGPQDAGEVPTRAPAVGGRPEHPHLAPIDRERTHLHEHLAGRRHRLGNVAKGDPAGSRAVCHQCAHRTRPFRSLGPTELVDVSFRGVGRTSCGRCARRRRSGAWTDRRCTTRRRTGRRA